MDLSILTSNPDLSADVAPDSEGLIKKYQENIYLSYTKWKKRYKEIEHARRYSLGRINRTTQAMVGEQVLQDRQPVLSPGASWRGCPPIQRTA